jgi:hypothetical protein
MLHHFVPDFIIQTNLNLLKMILCPHLCTVRYTFKRKFETFFISRYGTLLKKVGCEVGIYFDLDVGSGIRNETVQKGYTCKKNRELGVYVPDMGAWRNPETGAATILGSEKFHRIYDRIDHYVVFCKTGRQLPVN